MSQTEPSGGQPGAPGAAGGIGPAVLPPIWVGVNILFAVYGIWSSWPATYAYDIPDSALYLVYAGLAAAIVNILWGLWLVGLALGRSAGFPRHFVVWQIVNIVWIALREAYVLVTPDFVVTLRPMLYAAAAIVIGVICIALLRRPEAALAYPGSRTGRPPVIVSIIAALLGLVVGGVVGFGVGLGAGVIIAEATEMSCFEGACGFFAFFLGLGGMLIVAVAGAILAVWRTNRRPRAAGT